MKHRDNYMFLLFCEIYHISNKSGNVFMVQSYRLENSSDSVGMVMSLHCLGDLHEGHVFLSVNDLVSAPK